jgi:hypothetical protein
MGRGEGAETMPGSPMNGLTMPEQATGWSFSTSLGFSLSSH